MNDKQQVRKIATGVCMIATPVAVMSSYVLWPTMTSDAGKYVEETIDLGRGRVTAGLIVGGLGIPLAMIAIMGLVHLLHDRATRVGPIGGGLAIVGLALFAGFVGAGAALLEIASSDLGVAEKESLTDAVLTSPGMTIVIGGQFLQAAGFLLLAASLYAARVVPRPSAVLLGAFPIFYAVAWATESFPLVMLGLASLALALIPVGLEILSEPGEQWEHPPTFHGYRAVSV